MRRMHHGGDFVIDPLPNLLFTRDSSFWIGPRVAITSLALPARVRETSLTDLIYAHHPRFLGVRRAYESRSAPVEGGDVLLLAPGVVAVGVGERTTPAGAEALARSLFDDDLAHTVLAVPIAQERAQMHLDTVCTMVDIDAVVMYPNIVDSLSAFTIHRDGTAVCGSTTTQPFVEAAAADAMGIERLRVIDTGLDPVTAEREQWDDGNNTLALAPGVVVAYERNVETNARLADSGIEVLPIAGVGAGHRPRRPAVYVVPRRPATRSESSVGAVIASTAVDVPNQQPSAQFSWRPSAAGEGRVGTMQNEPPGVFGDDADVDPSAAVDQLGPADVVYVLAAVFTVMLALVIEADFRLVVTHVDERVVDTVADQDLGLGRGSPSSIRISRMRVSWGDCAPPSMSGSAIRARGSPRARG